MSSNIENPNPFIPENVYWSPDPQQFRIQITRFWSDIARGANQREIAAYDLNEIVTGQQWANSTNAQQTRDGFRKVFYLPAPLGAVASIPHGFTNLELSTFTWTKIIGAYTNQTGSPRGASIASEIDVFPTPGSNISFAVPVAYQVTYTAIVVLEYLKN